MSTQSEIQIPKKGDIIWVKNHGTLKWVKRTFSHSVRSGGVCCFVQYGLNIDYDNTHGWDEYSIFRLD